MTPTDTGTVPQPEIWINDERDEETTSLIHVTVKDDDKKNSNTAVYCNVMIADTNSGTRNEDLCEDIGSDGPFLLNVTPPGDSPPPPGCVREWVGSDIEPWQRPGRLTLHGAVIRCASFKREALRSSPSSTSTEKVLIHLLKYEQVCGEDEKNVNCV
ncbi:hypothetical protein F2P81_012434 [Scophthalmus maximus]|uniref:Uncharacterized protein n=1 Tax=Scophthalmus maximus TaxID=52904 RepID=A0A6A4SHN5_SCOMX|nr:hypothetical protein F2P81_012434 [Scophthalmus maximus]